ncbi:hypothetical protein [Pseudanabaena sp. UWO311]|uniref:hypothetical protein n=1 Tax=Pseudanabaena sp. UWO311 TaxID=2487337 RepID=UPI0030DA2C35
MAIFDFVILTIARRSNIECNRLENAILPSPSRNSGAGHSPAPLFLDFIYLFL